MTEMLAIPGWRTPPTSLADWVAVLEGRAGPAVVVERESSQGAWIHLESIQARGFAVLAGPHVEAINFEVDAPDPSSATKFIEDAAAAIGWEVHPDDGEDEEDD